MIRHLISLPDHHYLLSPISPRASPNTHCRPNDIHVLYLLFLLPSSPFYCCRAQFFSIQKNLSFEVELSSSSNGYDMSFPHFFKSFTYRLPDGSLPRYHGAVIGDAIWISVGKIKLLDIPWALLGNDKPVDSLKEGAVKNSCLPFDSVRLLRLPSFSFPPAWWRAYQPVYPIKGNRWFIVTEEDDVLERTDTREVEGSLRYVFPIVLSNEIIKDCRRLEDDMESIRLFNSFPPHASVPVLPRLAALHETYSSAQEILRTYIEFLCYYWGGQGVFRWWGLQNDLYAPQFNWKLRLPPLTRGRVIRWNLENLPCRGVIVNLAVDRRSTDLNLMIHAEVGFVYRWTRGLQEDVRYARWSPEYLARLVRFYSNCEIEGVQFFEEDFARQFAGMVKTVTSYDSNLSRIEAVKRPQDSFLNIVKVVDGISNAYFALMEGWEPLSVDTNMEWNSLARHFQVNQTTKSNVKGTVYVAIAQRPFADSILPDGPIRRHISRLYCSWEAMSCYWTVPTIQKWMIHGLHSPSLVITLADRRHGSILLDTPYYPPPEFDYSLFSFLMPITNRWRLDYLRDGEAGQLVTAAFQSQDLLLLASAPIPEQSQRPPGWAHTVMKDSGLEDLQNGGETAADARKAPIVKEMVVNLREEFGGKEGQVRDSVGNRLMWGVIGRVNRAKTKDLMEAKITGSQPGSSKEVPDVLLPNSSVILRRLKVVDETHFSLIHCWPLEKRERKVAQVLMNRARLLFLDEGEICIKILVARDKSRRKVEEIILSAIEHGIPFQFAGRINDLAALQGVRPNSTSDSPDNDLTLMARMHNWNLSQAFFHNEGPECGNEYLKILRVLETHESASSLVGMGGVISYIVRRHMPHLVNYFLAGISPQTTRWRSGETFIAPSDGQEVWLDEPSRELINMVVGLRYDEINPEGGTIFPHPDWYETDPEHVTKTTKKRVLWTPWVWESSLVTQLQIISSNLESGTAKARTRSQWSRLFRCNRQSKIPWNTIGEELDELRDISFGGRWNDWSLVELQNELTQITNNENITKTNAKKRLTTINE